MTRETGTDAFDALGVLVCGLRIKGNTFEMLTTLVT